MPAVGRNEPCPCGSGKKYKKCCMLKESAVDLETFRRERAEESLRGDVLKFATAPRFQEEMVGAFRTYHNDAIDTSLLLKQDPLENIRFLDWFINEHAHSSENKRMIELFAEQRARQLDEDQKNLLEEWMSSRLGAFEVASTEGGVLRLKDLFSEKTYSIEDRSACEELESGQAVVARITGAWGKRQLGGAPIILPPEKKQTFIDSVNAEFEEYKEKHPDSDLPEFLSKSTHRLLSLAASLQ